jgi:hypothetical protein
MSIERFITYPESVATRGRLAETQEQTRGQIVRRKTHFTKLLALA